MNCRSTILQTDLSRKAIFQLMLFLLPLFLLHFPTPGSAVVYLRQDCFKFLFKRNPLSNKSTPFCLNAVFKPHNNQELSLVFSHWYIFSFSEILLIHTSKVRHASFSNCFSRLTNLSVIALNVEDDCSWWFFYSRDNLTSAIMKRIKSTTNLYPLSHFKSIMTVEYMYLAVE